MLSAFSLLILRESIHVEACESNLQGLENIETGKINLILAYQQRYRADS